MIQLKFALLIILIGLLEITSFLAPTQAKLSQTSPKASDPQKPPRSGSPDGREPGGTRGPCEDVGSPFTPLLPVTDSEFSGFTLTEYPTFWFYIPYQTSSVSSGKFTLEDREENLVYRLRFKLPETPGFVRVSLPTTEKALEKNKDYRWTLMLYCTSPGSSERDRVWHQGWVERLEMPELESLVQTAPLTQQLELYIENNIWYDASINLPQIRNSPTDWERLLRAIGLEELEQEAIAGDVEGMEN
ncbi:MULTISPECIES: DUF928 domain-containing protein [unclassified Coleofasciculus]|uniref:DUF928 domain-containing protein n=1 Tax=unclassified Coleofasciculus TaxID=2692782 RepID=UPI00187FCF43|nr:MULTISPECIES: DUF928 domain-containing protein [unclassified Coleofasciculus]MBE9129247.1 DUF928 domain-containing protein [Coleofasciculus sp. LEGE 07081]MBE9151905.1 DUF928 domain-containing protein [Coleofasciculus sp. LEGE 07092]